jgi:ABC-type spermidine/putrescine transport system permease subunit I
LAGEAVEERLEKDGHPRAARRSVLFLSSAARTFVWRAILGREGFVNAILTGLGIVDRPVDWLLFSSSRSISA